MTTSWTQVGQKISLAAVAFTLAACTDTPAPAGGSAFSTTTSTATGGTVSGSAPGTGEEGNLGDYVYPSDPSKIYATRGGLLATFETAVQEETLGDGDLTLLMIVDRSSSMAEYFGDAPKSAVAKASFSAAVAGVEDALTVGAILFPEGPGGGCAVAPISDPHQIQFQRARYFAPRWEASDVGNPDGGTPIGLAFSRADEAVRVLEADGFLQRRVRIVLVTDGQPSCGEDPETLVAQTDAWREKGIQVEVVGLPGSEPARLLLHRLAGLDPATLPPQSPAESTWTEDTSGYVAPGSSDQVDDSFDLLVK